VPTYQYACTECGHAFDQFQSFSDDALTVCPECDGRLRKVFNAVGVVFKGSGFYRTDSRSSGSSTSGTPASSSSSSSSSESTSGSGSSSSGTSSSKSESKPAPAGATKD
jgi:putative FmdB family regulatory protein